MADIDVLLAEIDELPSEQLETVYQHVVRRRQPVYWLVPGENLKAIQEIMKPVYEQTAAMTDDEINVAIDEALSEVRAK